MFSAIPVPACPAPATVALPWTKQAPPKGRPHRTVKDLLVAALIVLTASAVVYAEESVQDWIPDVLAFPEDTEVVTDRAIGSSIRMFTITTGTDVEALFTDWENSLNSNGYPVTQGADDVLDGSIEFNGPGIANAKIIVAPTSQDGRRIIEFDATLD